MTVVRKEALAFAMALGLFREPGGCGDVDDPQGGTNAPCTRNSDCRSDLECSEGVCTEPGPKDGGSEAGASGDAA